MQNVREMSDEMLIGLLDKRVELEFLNDAELVDYIREVMFRELFYKFDASSIYDFLTRARYKFPGAVAQRKMDAARIMQLLPEVKDLVVAEELNVSQLAMFGQALRQKPAPSDVVAEILELIRNQTLDNTQIILCEKLGIEVKKKTKIRFQKDGSVRVEVTFSKDEWDLLMHAKDVLSHTVPGGELKDVITHCAQFTVGKKDPGAPRRSATSAPEVKVRQCKGVSRTVRRIVFQRDKTCRQLDRDGRPCGSHYQLQVDHIQSRWDGGGNELENLQLLCSTHNRYKYRREAGLS